MPDPEAGPVCRPAGDRHLVLELGGGLEESTGARVRSIEKILLDTAPPGLTETVPSYTSLLMRFDPTVTSSEVLARVALSAAGAVGAPGAEVGDDLPRTGTGGPISRPEVVVPVVYGGEWGPDLEDVARHTGLAPQEVVKRHAAGCYLVSVVGFAPGFAYLGGMDPALATPRLASPRPRVPAGSVGIASGQTGIYPAALPGGWRIIGRTPLPLWRPGSEEPATLIPGRAVRFVPAGEGPAGWERAVEMASRSLDAEGRPASTGAPPREQAGVSRVTARDVALVQAAGPFDSIQDAGRWGYARLGVPESGPLDWPAMARANLALGNQAGAAAIEATYSGLVLGFIRPVVAAVSAGARVRLSAGGNQVYLAPESPVTVGAGDQLEILAGEMPRTYIAFSGGLWCPPVLGSRSTYAPAALGGPKGRRLQPGDVLQVATLRGSREDRPETAVPPAEGEGGSAVGCREAGATAPRQSRRRVEVRVVRGPEAERFPPRAVGVFFRSVWSVSGSSDRRACLLSGEPMDAPQGGGISSGSPAGSVQVLPSGLPLVLLPDHQTIGGYPKLATVITFDLPRLGQAWPGDEVRFVEVSAAAARGLWETLRRDDPEEWRIWACQARDQMPPLERGVPGRRVFRMGLGGRSHLVAVERLPVP